MLTEKNVIAYVEGNYSKEYGQILNSNKISVLKASGNTEITAVQEDELSDDEISGFEYKKLWV